MAGTVAARGEGGSGVVGVAPRARVMAVKGLDDDGSGLDSQLAAAIVYAADNGADVVNASWSGRGASDAIREAVDYAARPRRRRGGRGGQRGRGRTRLLPRRRSSP